MAIAKTVALIYVPCGSDDEATRIARTLLDERLIACGNIYESRSLYRWEGALVDEREHVLVCKTLVSKAQEAEKRIVQLHSYDVPCVISIMPAHVNIEYASWVAGEIIGTDDRR
jgi:periplasmic divalent cation tolerance protein